MQYQTGGYALKFVRKFTISNPSLNQYCSCALEGSIESIEERRSKLRGRFHQRSNFRISSLRGRTQFSRVDNEIETVDKINATFNVYILYKNDCLVGRSILFLYSKHLHDTDQKAVTNL